METKMTANGAVEYVRTSFANLIDGQVSTLGEYTLWFDTTNHYAWYTNTYTPQGSGYWWATVQGATDGPGGPTSGSATLGFVPPPFQQEVTSYYQNGSGVRPTNYTRDSGQFERTAASQLTLQTEIDNDANGIAGYIIHVDSRDLAGINALSDPGDFSVVPENIAPAAADSISILGKPIDSDGNVYVQLKKNQKYGVTPTSNSRRTYAKLGLSLQSPKKVTMTWARHPLFTTNAPTLKQIQAKFTTGATNLLFIDNDEKLTDLQATNQNKFRSDDVPLYVEFKILQSSNAWADVTVVTNGVTNVFQFTRTNFFIQVSADDQITLLNYGSFSHIKQVQSLVGVGGKALISGHSVLFPDNPTALATVHEWGHNAGLNHRGETGGNNPSSGSTNEDRIAIMLSSNTVQQVEINRHERQKMLDYQ